MTRDYGPTTEELIQEMEEDTGKTTEEIIAERDIRETVGHWKENQSEKEEKYSRMVGITLGAIIVPVLELIGIIYIASM